MNLPRKWENAIDKAMKERIWGCSRSELQFLAYKLCALTQKPQRELTDAEIEAISDKVEFAKFADDLAFARACIAAHQRKQQEPDTVKFRAARRKDTGRVDMLRADFELSDWEWLPGEPQEYEVTLP